MGNLCSTSNKHSKYSTKSSQTDLNPHYAISNRELINNRYQNYKSTPNYPKPISKTKHPTDNVHLKTSVLADWKHPARNNDNDDLICDNYNFNHSNTLKTKDNNKLTGVWPINGSGDCNNQTDNPKQKHQRKIPTITHDALKLDYHVNLSDEEDNNVHNYNCLSPNNELTVNNNNNINPNNNFDNVNQESPSNKIRINKTNRKSSSSNKSLKIKDNNNIVRNKSKKLSNNHKMKLNSNSNNHSILPEQQKNNGNSTNSSSQKFHSSSLLDQDSYPIQYTFYVDDNDTCTKPFYDRRMVAIAKTCRCRIYFHAKSDENEKPLYYKGKPVRPVTITSPDMACLKRCLGSIDSQFPYFNCKAFLSLSC